MNSHLDAAFPSQENVKYWAWQDADYEFRAAYDEYMENSTPSLYAYAKAAARNVKEV